MFSRPLTPVGFPSDVRWWSAPMPGEASSISRDLVCGRQKSKTADRTRAADRKTVGQEGHPGGRAQPGHLGTLTAECAPPGCVGGGEGGSAAGGIHREGVIAEVERVTWRRAENGPWELRAQSQQGNGDLGSTPANHSRKLGEDVPLAQPPGEVPTSRHRDVSLRSPCAEHPVKTRQTPE